MIRFATSLLLLLPAVALAQTTAPATKPKPTASPQLEVHFLPLQEHGESILIKTPQGKHLLIDAGLPTAGPEVIEYLQEQGVKRIDLLILSHDDPDHAGGMLDLLRSLPVTELWDSPRPGTGSLHRALLEAAVKKGVKRTTVRRGFQRTLEPGLTFEALGPTRPWFTTLGRVTGNPNSLVLRLTWKQTRFLFTGDMYVASEARLLKRKADVACHLLKVAHHGSTTSSSLSFLQATKAKAAVICCDASLGFPRPKVLRNLKAASIDWYRTDRNGAVVVRSRGVPAGDLSISVARGKKNDTQRNLLRPFRLASKYANEVLRAGSRLTRRVFTSKRLVGKPTKRTFHRDDCHVLDRAKALTWVEYSDRKAASKAGRLACALCFTP